MCPGPHHQAESLSSSVFCNKLGCLWDSGQRSGLEDNILGRGTGSLLHYWDLIEESNTRQSQLLGRHQMKEEAFGNTMYQNLWTCQSSILTNITFCLIAGEQSLFLFPHSCTRDGIQDLACTTTLNYIPSFSSWENFDLGLEFPKWP